MLKPTVNYIYIQSVSFVLIYQVNALFQASGSWDKTVRLWNPRNGQPLHVLEGHEGWVQALAFSPDGIYVASAGDDESVRIWDVAEGTCINVLEVRGRSLRVIGALYFILLKKEFNR